MGRSISDHCHTYKKQLVFYISKVNIYKFIFVLTQDVSYDVEVKNKVHCTRRKVQLCMFLLSKILDVPEGVLPARDLISL